MTKTYPQLYARSSLGKILVWWGEQNGDKYRFTHGILDGKLVSDIWTVAKTTNEGRVNERNPEQQAEFEVKAKYKKQLEQGGYHEKIQDVDNVTFVEPMLCKQWEEYKDKTSFPLASQGKLDGMRLIITSQGMFSRKGKPVISAPHIFEELKELCIHSGVIFDGEIYTDKLKSDFDKLMSLARQTKPTQEDLDKSRAQLEYHVYDIVDVNKSFTERFNILQNIIKLNNFKYVKLCSTVLVNNQQELDSEYAKYLENGMEGQIIRVPGAKYQNKRTKDILKRKEFLDEEFEIIDIIEGDGNRSGMFGRAVLKNNDGKVFQSNARGSEETYIEILKNKKDYIGKMATVRYQNRTPDNIPRFPVIVDFNRQD